MNDDGRVDIDERQDGNWREDASCNDDSDGRWNEADSDDEGGCYARDVGKWRQDADGNDYYNESRADGVGRNNNNSEADSDSDGSNGGNGSAADEDGDWRDRPPDD